MMFRSLTWALLPMLVGAAPKPALRGPSGQVSALSLSSTGGTAKLMIATDRGVAVKETRLQNPDRLVLDFEPALKGDFASYDGQHRGNVADIRVNQFKANVVRVVVEFDRMPDYKVDQAPGGAVTVSFADKPFDSWGGVNGGAAATGSIAGTEASYSAPVIQSEPEPIFTGYRAQPQDSGRFDVNWDKTDINDALQQLARRSGQSIVAGPNVKGTVSFSVTNQTWGNIFQALLAANGLSAQVMPGGIIRVDVPGELSKLDSVSELTQALVRLNYAKASEMAVNIKGMLSKQRGTATADTSTNTLILSDTPNRVAAIRRFVESLDIKTSMVSIQAKLVFVDRTNLSQLGIKYDVGSANQYFNKVVARTDPTTGQPYVPNVNVVNLGGNSVSAVSNADALISNSALDLIFSTAIGGFSVTSFLSALEQVELTDVEAQPIIHTLDNRQAQINSGEQTPVRIIDASSLGTGAPRATVSFKETGIRLTATPHVTADRHILLDLEVERSSIQPLASADLGYNIPIQHANTKLLVNDGEVAVIAGLTVTTVTKTRQGIPFLQSLPFIGNLFAFSSTSEHRQDLIFLVTPRITDDPTGN
jgi:type IV pilus assembly protein PilQ